ncbi:TMEM175 family protein [Undibacterium arcticum]|uniref:TMEM175 family protein n=1 Tax=Undibacterium arcticum TaxID=1762892 RepID=A0ABV7F498_9BURK
MTKSRLESFSDGVIAIAITILVSSRHIHWTGRNVCQN